MLKNNELAKAKITMAPFDIMKDLHGDPEVIMVQLYTLFERAIDSDTPEVIISSAVHKRLDSMARVRYPELFKGINPGDSGRAMDAVKMMMLSDPELPEALSQQLANDAKRVHRAVETLLGVEDRDVCRPRVIFTSAMFHTMFAEDPETKEYVFSPPDFILDEILEAEKQAEAIFSGRPNKAVGFKSLFGPGPKNDHEAHDEN